MVQVLSIAKLEKRRNRKTFSQNNFATPLFFGIPLSFFHPQRPISNISKIDLLVFHRDKKGVRSR
jgi:hypothetical protein